jgi:hypothetical protein
MIRCWQTIGECSRLRQHAAQIWVVVCRTGCCGIEELRKHLSGRHGSSRWYAVPYAHVSAALLFEVMLWLLLLPGLQGMWVVLPLSGSGLHWCIAAVLAGCACHCSSSAAQSS